MNLVGGKVDMALQSCQNELSTHRNSLEQANKRANTAVAQRESLTADVNRLKTQIVGMNQQLQGHSDVIAELKSANIEVEESTKDLNSGQSAQTIYEKLKKNFLKKNFGYLARCDF